MTNPTEDQQEDVPKRGRPVGSPKSEAEIAAISAAAKARWAARRAMTPEMVLYSDTIRAIETARQADIQEEDIQELIAQALGLGEA
jgi:hypothetical protein